ncbi:VapC toxin family PIN domain ribonuclease [bacterium endosymbiont of Escarpia laminata]|nr:MAG: VapC toxin family PIN domain ribonuclease [bacterium endosymbiont of Escarpia laminata]
MKAVDTNVLVRFLVKDDEQQAAIVHRLLNQYEEQKESLFVPVLVVFELLWVLEAVYGVEREEMVRSVNDLMVMPVFEFEQQSAVRAFLSSADQSSCDLSDLLIAHSAAAAGCDTTYTFDKKASKFDLFEAMTG